MKIAVYDTHVRKKSGDWMHFDIMVPDTVSQEKVLEYGRDYLESAGQEGQPCTAKECEFCHTEMAAPHIAHSILGRGYHVHELEGCRE